MLRNVVLGLGLSLVALIIYLEIDRYEQRTEDTQETAQPVEAPIRPPKVSRQAILFEDWVVEHIDTTSCALVWGPDSAAQANRKGRRPDMQVTQKVGTGDFPFALECKWLKSLDNGSIDVTGDRMEELRNYEMDHAVPVFVVVGVGGGPGSPAELYVAPIHRMENATFDKEELDRYRQARTGKTFQYNALEQKLSY